MRCYAEQATSQERTHEQMMDLFLNAVLLRVVRQSVFLWCDSASNSKQYYIGRQMHSLDAALLQKKPPSSINRLPCSLTLRRYWKALDWRSSLLFYSPIVLKSLLPREYFRHWSLFVFSIYTVSQ